MWGRGRLGDGLLGWMCLQPLSLFGSHVDDRLGLTLWSVYSMLFGGEFGSFVVEDLSRGFGISCIRLCYAMLQ